MSKIIEEAAIEHALNAADAVILNGEMETNYVERARLSFIEGADFALSHQWRSGRRDGYPKERETVIGAVFDDSGCLYGLWQVQYLGKESNGVPIYKTVFDWERINVTHWLPIPSLNPGQR